MITRIPQYVKDWQKTIVAQKYDRAIPQSEVERVTEKKLAVLYNWATSEHYIAWAGGLSAGANALASYCHTDAYNTFPLLNPTLGIAALVTVAMTKAIRDGTIAGLLQDVDRTIKMPETPNQSLQPITNHVHRFYL